MEGTTWTPCSAPEVALYPRSQQLDRKTGDACIATLAAVKKRCFVSPQKNLWSFQVSSLFQHVSTTSEVCFSGSVLLETFDIEVVSYDGNSKFESANYL